MASQAIRFGSVFDSALQEWWSAGPLHGREAANAKLDELVKANDKLLSPYDVEKARALLYVYDARWGNEPYEIIRVQPIFRQPILNPVTGRKSKRFDLGGKLDVLVRDVRTGEVLIIETKTTSLEIAMTSDYWRTITALDPQISTYFSGARTILKSIGIKDEPARAVYDVIRKPALKPYKATPPESRKYKKGTTELYANQRETDETPEEYGERVMEDITGQVVQTGPGFDAKLALESSRKYFARGDIVRFESEEFDHQMDVWNTAEAIIENEKAERAPRHRGACKRYGGFCSFFGVCNGSVSIDSFEVIDERHPELSELKEV